MILNLSCYEGNKEVKRSLRARDSYDSINDKNSGDYVN